MRVELRRCAATGRPLRLTRIEEDDGALTMVSADPPASLADVIESYTGYSERSAAPLRRLELPSVGIVLIFDFGPTLRFLDAKSGTLTGRHHGGFVAGLSERPVLTETTGVQSGLHVSLTPLGARRLLGLPMGELANTVLGIDDAFGTRGRELTDALRDTEDWPRRFALVDAAVARRLADTDPCSPLAYSAWRRLMACDGQIPVAALAAELDCSRKHLSAVFRDQIGLTPKRLSRMMRFRTAIDHFDRGLCDGWADIAHACGYTDQAHFIHDFRDFSGATPTEFLQRRRPHEDATLAG